MQNRHLVVVGASAGGIEALRELVSHLPTDFAAPIAVVVHTSPQSPGILHEILSRSGPLPAHDPQTGERLRSGHIYVAPPDRHLLVEPGIVRLTRGPRENRFRPAIDPLFRAAAQVYGPGAIGVILTGNLDDGAAGLVAIKRLGGMAIVQDPADATFPSMPASALAAVAADHVVPLSAIAPLLTSIVGAPVPKATVAVPRDLDLEIRIAREEDPIGAGVTTMGEPSTFACPECHGVLLRIKDEGGVRFRCHTGHAYSAESLLADIGEGIEDSLWNAIRSMQEGALLLRQLGEHTRAAHDPDAGARLRARADELTRHADTLRDMVTSAVGEERAVRGVE